jgi:Trp operon repressor
MKRKKTDLSEIDFVKTLDYLYTAAGSVRGRSGMKQFLKDLLTPSERIMLGRRIWIARLLLSGVSQRQIGERLHVGPNTIAKVHHWLSDQLPGYEEAISGLEQEIDKRALQTEAAIDRFSLTALKRRYPLHFLLFPKPVPKKRYRQSPLD